LRRPFKGDRILSGSELRGLKKKGLNQEGIFVGEGIERMGRNPRVIGDRKR
jgi:hypothetical protein